MKGLKVDSETRIIHFINGDRRTFKKITCVDTAHCNWVRYQYEEGIAILNPDKINYIVIVKKDEKE